MGRRIFFYSGNFSNASHLFTRVIWKKSAPSCYRKRVRQEIEELICTYTLEIHHHALAPERKATGTDNNIVLITESTHRTRPSRNCRSKTLYRILTCEEVRREQILTEEVGVFVVKAELLAHSGKAAPALEPGSTLTLTVKPGLSVTIAANKELYLPFATAKVQADF